MTDNQPIMIQPAEWEEIAAFPDIREMWGMSEDETAEDLAAMVYGVKFNFHSGVPGYVGELFILQGDVLTGDPPLILIREEGKLVWAYAES